MAETKYYWHGKGQYLLGGEKYTTGKEIPADQIGKIDKKRLADFMAEGLISTHPVPMPPAPKPKGTKGATDDGAKDARIAELEKENERLKAEAGKGKGGRPPKCKECEPKDKRISELESALLDTQAELEGAKANVANLEETIAGFTSAKEQEPGEVTEEGGDSNV